jgi:hypothetical protein
LQAGLGALVKIFEHNVPSVFDNIGVYVSPEKTKRLLKDFASKVRPLCAILARAHGAPLTPAAGQVSDAGMILHAVRGIGRHVNDREVASARCKQSVLFRSRHVEAARTLMVCSCARAHRCVRKDVACYATSCVLTSTGINLCRTQRQRCAALALLLALSQAERYRYVFLPQFMRLTLPRHAT